MKRLLLLFLLVILFTASVAQSGRKSIYPVILVHGLVGSDGTWYKTMQQYQQSGYNVSIDHSRVNYDATGGAGAGSRLDFALNANGLATDATTDFNYVAGKLNYGDVLDMGSPIDGNNDVFVMNFNNGIYSNQAAIYKQGFALGIAIQKVLAATKAEKVILVGHSMGGLAIREYLQNSRFLFYGNNATHKVYRAVTIGTPHGGSNTGSGDLNLQAGIKAFYQKWIDERSEAVRDLRTNHLSSGKQGIYLWGGLESNATHGIVGIGFYNTDINCNGRADEVGGLNSAKASLLPTDIYFECIVSEVAGLKSDFIVTTTSQNLNNFITKLVDGNKYDFAVITNITNVAHIPIAGFAGESEQSIRIMRSAMLAINIPIAPSNYMVLLTGNTTNNVTEGFASYLLDIPTKGRLDVGYRVANSVYSKISIQKDNAVGAYLINAPQTSVISGLDLAPGRYYVSLQGRMNFDGYSTAALELNFKPEALGNEPVFVSRVFPNPTTGAVTIESELLPKTIECYNLIGQSVPFAVTNSGIDIQQKGLCFVRIDNQTHRVLVE